MPRADTSPSGVRQLLLALTIAITGLIITQDFLGPFLILVPLKALPAWLLCARLVLAVPLRRARLIVAGLLLGSIGDVVLGFSNFFAPRQLFIVGLASFLLGHLCYTTAFLGQRRLRRDRLGWAALVVVLGGSLVWSVAPGLGPMRVPVLAYALVIATMALAAVFRASDRGMVMFGALVFMVSDGLIAINLFAHKVPLFHLWAFSTYVMAQLLISEGWARDSAEAPIEVRAESAAPAT
jgi:uncharacterized membrane protein YhhN